MKKRGGEKTVSSRRVVERFERGVDSLGVFEVGKVRESSTILRGSDSFQIIFLHSSSLQSSSLKGFPLVGSDEVESKAEDDEHFDDVGSKHRPDSQLVGGSLVGLVEERSCGTGGW